MQAPSAIQQQITFFKTLITHGSLRIVETTTLNKVVTIQMWFCPSALSLLL